VAEREEIDANRTITTSIALLGFLIVAMSMVALANAITMNVLDRTRETGILRCIGARARDVRRIFTTEGITLALAGWLLGVPSATRSTACSSGLSGRSSTCGFQSPSHPGTF
jgi:putative ABC transport system permease protein